MVEGLVSKDYYSALLRNTPETIRGFFETVREMEHFSQLDVNNDSITSIASPPQSNADPKASTKAINISEAIEEPLIKILKNLDENIARLSLSRKVRNRSRHRSDTISHTQRLPGSLNQVQCYNCQGYGHISRYCLNRL